MRLLYDLFKDLPSTPVLKERIALAEDRYRQAVEDKERVDKENKDLRQRVAELERGNAELRARVPAEPGGDLGEETQRVLVFLFRGDDREMTTGSVAHVLGEDRGVAQYHIDLLRERGLAIQTGFEDDYCWGLTAEGRRYVVEHGLHTR